MAKLGNVTFTGLSGQSYKATVFPFNITFKEGIGGVYVVSKRTENEEGQMSHDWFYVGSASDLRENFKMHTSAFQFRKYEVNAINVIREDDAGKRKEIYEDLVHQLKPLLNEMF